MIALKSHITLVSKADRGANVQLLGVSILYIDYGSSLRLSIIAYDAFYSLSEVFSLVIVLEM
jgi:hypothetical protein